MEKGMISLRKIGLRKDKRCKRSILYDKKGIQLKLCNAGASIRNLLKLADLETLFEIYESEHAAVMSANIAPKT